MWKPIQAPGEWLVFLQREDIKSLPIMEARKKYMQEQLLFEGYINNVNTVNTVNTTTSAPASAAAGGGGLRKFKYPSLFELVELKGSAVGFTGDYERVAVSQLKQYWYDNFYVPPAKYPGYFSVPPPPSPDVDLGSDFVFINPSGGGIGAKIIAWGRPKTRGRQRGQWTIWQFAPSGLVPPADTPEGNWEVRTTGPTNLKTPSGTYLYQDIDSKSGKIMVYFSLREKQPVKGDLVVTGGSSSDVTYIGAYNKDPDSGVGQDTVYIREDGAYKIYYSSTCSMWRIDQTGTIKLSCATWTGNPTGTDQRGTYQLSGARSPETGTYIVA